MEINITPLFRAPSFVPFDMANNRATLGDDAGPLTWSASLECAQDDETPNLLDTEEKRGAFRFRPLLRRMDARGNRRMERRRALRVIPAMGCRRHSRLLATLILQIGTGTNTRRTTGFVTAFSAPNPATCISTSATN